MMTTDQYDADDYCAEVYDLYETRMEDVELLRGLIGDARPLRILEPFCGTGRILIPLACDGHKLVGIDRAGAMLRRAQIKIEQLSPDVQGRITLHQADVIETVWPGEFDVVVLGGNCFYELASPAQQEACIASAAAALKPGGHIFVDNDHMDGELAESWRQVGQRQALGVRGTCADGTRVEGASETIWFDAPKRLWRAKRWTTVIFPDGQEKTTEWTQQKHPVSFGEVEGWLTGHGFVIDRTFGDRFGNPCASESTRATFWATKQK